MAKSNLLSKLASFLVDGSDPLTMLGANSRTPEELIQSWDGAQLSGLAQILLDLPTQYKMFRLVEFDLRTNAANAALILRVGPTAGGAVDTGASDYNNILLGYGGTGTTPTVSSAQADWAFCRQITQHTGRTELIMSDGSTAQWSSQLQSSVYDTPSSRDALVVRGHRRVGTAYRANRLQIGFNGALVNSGFLRLYGIR